MKNITIYIFFLFGCCSLMAQSYTTAAGLRIGNGIGISVQQKIAKFSTIEAILRPSIGSDDISIDLLYEQHQRVLSKRFNIYVGGGVHKAWRSEGADDFGKADTGISAIIGGEFSLKKFNISWDYKPTIDVLGGDGNNFSHGTAVSLRYIIVPQKKNENWKIWKKETRENRKEKKAKEKAKEERKKRRKEAGWKFWEW